MEDEIRAKLFEMQDVQYKKFQSSLCPNTDSIIGVRIPILKKYAKDLLKKYNLEELLQNIGEKYYEEIMLKGILIGLDKSDIINTIKHTKEFVPKIDNWAVCDVFCAGLKITLKHKSEIWKVINEYLKSSKEFEIRFAIVMILDYYIDEDYLNQDFKIFDSVNNEGYYAKMAVAWAVSIALIKYYDDSLKYLQSCKLDNFTYNKAIQKAIESYRITDEQKRFLKSIKR